MSIQTTPTELARTQEDVRHQLTQIAEPWEKSAQAVGDPHGRRHNDGEKIHQSWGLPPFFKTVRKLESRDHPATKFPIALLDSIVHVSDRDIDRLKSGDDFADEPRTRREMLRWFQDGTDAFGRPRWESLSAGGTDTHVHGSPGSGKSTLGHNIASWRMQVNNETFIWADQIGDDGTNERTEWLPFAPWATIAVPSGLEVRVRIVPDNAAIKPFTVPLEAICRDVLRYDSATDLIKNLVPGQFYVAFPDPHFRGCEKVTRFAYTSPWEAETPFDATPFSHFWFAAFASRVTGDHFMHPTSVLIDEAGNLLEQEAAKDEHDTLQKVSFWQRKYADARKKGLSVYYLTHALVEIHHKIRRKIRWWLTCNGTEPPIGQSLPGGKSCPMTKDLTSGMTTGQGQIWTPRGPPKGQFTGIEWTNTKKFAQLDAEISIEFPGVADVFD